MPTIKIKNSQTATNTPGSLVQGELAINEQDQLLFYRDGSGTVQSFDLTTTGGGGGATGGGVLVPLGIVTASGASSVEFVNGQNGVVLDSTYEEYEIHFYDASPSSDSAQLYVRTSTNAGSTYDSGASDYSWNFEGKNSAGAITNASAAASEIRTGLGWGNAAGENANGIVRISNPAGTNNTSVEVKVWGSGPTTGHAVFTKSAGTRLSAADVDAVQLLMNTGNISGTFVLYGLDKSASAGSAGGGNLVALGTVTASNSTSVDFINGVNGVVLDATYDKYIVECIDVVPATDNADLFVRTTTDATNFDAGASDYGYAYNGTTSIGGLSGYTGTAAQVFCGASIGSAAGESCNSTIELFKPSGTNETQIKFSTSVLDSAGNLRYYDGTGVRNSAADVDGIRILMSAGNIVSGTFILYGLDDSAGATGGAGDGSLVLLGEITANGSADVQFINGTNGIVFDNTYTSYRIIGTDIRSSTDGVNFFARVGNGSFDSGASDYNYALARVQSNVTGVTTSTSTGASFLVIGGGVSNNTNELTRAVVEIMNPSNTATEPVFGFDMQTNRSSGNFNNWRGGGTRVTAKAIDRIQLYMSAGNIYGTFKLYGIK